MDNQNSLLFRVFFRNLAEGFNHTFSRMIKAFFVSIELLISGVISVIAFLPFFYASLILIALIRPESLRLIELKQAKDGFGLFHPSMTVLLITQSISLLVLLGVAFKAGGFKIFKQSLLKSLNQVYFQPQSKHLFINVFWLSLNFNCIIFIVTTLIGTNIYWGFLKLAKLFSKIPNFILSLPHHFQNVNRNFKTKILEKNPILTAKIEQELLQSKIPQTKNKTTRNRM